MRDLMEINLFHFLFYFFLRGAGIFSYLCQAKSAFWLIFPVNLEIKFVPIMCDIPFTSTLLRTSTMIQSRIINGNGNVMKFCMLRRQKNCAYIILVRLICNQWMEHIWKYAFDRETIKEINRSVYVFLSISDILD